ncbi:MAG: VOC family protein [Pseudomonadales bacterium]|jgi:catechol-2,3-dioxygenase|nr:glyoxalase [Acidiferrobacteraceae bacterium]MDP6375446.1 VOC family protein [Pseudomonadales bacterium]MDP6470649.1 VOC family protein [Pseudomonadales bacterium]MDP6828495.1 VOC family protein [Pseudomonadales bacterium]MDP6970520.1 VOC family protein [Pseudomonadales bacterium]|tara:strand:+ start:3041 stop:3481 length:441 start_codon:yes stop_codon:yes gene_type:complete
MKVKLLGDVVLNVVDLKRSERFYSGVLGPGVCARFDEQGMKMTSFTFGDHHDLAIAQVSGEDGESSDQATGLNHVAFCIGESLSELVEANKHLKNAGVTTVPIDHEVTQSRYFDDPDGNNVEFYVDTSNVWKQDPQRIAQVAPLDI